MRISRTVGRLNLTGLVLLILIIITLINIYQNPKEKTRQQVNPPDKTVQPTRKLPSTEPILTKSRHFCIIIRTNPFIYLLATIEEKPIVAPKEPARTNEEIPAKNFENRFAEYSSDEHLLSLLRRQATAQGEVIATIIGGDSYSLFAWDWYERMFEISNDTNNCHCFVIAMDEIGVVLATQQKVPVYFSTFSFDMQMNWINNIEARQHSLYRVGHAKFDTTARIVRMGYSVVLSEMDVFW